MEGRINNQILGSKGLRKAEGGEGSRRQQNINRGLQLIDSHLTVNKGWRGRRNVIESYGGGAV